MKHQQAFDEAADRFESIISAKIQPQLAKVATADAALAKLDADDLKRSAAEQAEILRKRIALLRSRRADVEILADAINQARAALDDISCSNAAKSMSGTMADLRLEAALHREADIQKMIDDTKAEVRSCRKYTSVIVDKAADPVLSGGNFVEAVRRGLVIPFRPRGATATDLNAAVSDTIQRHRTDI